jgi:hypothetical protein
LELLHSIHQRRATALTQFGRHADAAKDFAQAAKLNWATLDSDPLLFACYLARWGEHIQPVAEANAVAEDKDVQADSVYNAACVCALASSSVKKDPKLAEQYATRALELLRQAVAKGFKDVAHMKQDTDLDGLRGRDDFKKLMAQLEERLQGQRKRGPSQGTPDGW